MKTKNCVLGMPRLREQAIREKRLFEVAESEAEESALFTDKYSE